MASPTLLKLACAIVVCAVVATPRVVESAVTCGLVSKNLAQCITYLKSAGNALPSSACCAGVRTLKSMTSSPADRKTACGCLKTAAGNIKGVSYAKAAQLPRNCGVSISYAISPTTDCSKVN